MMSFQTAALSLCLTGIVATSGCSLSTSVPSSRVVEINRKAIDPEIAAEFQAFLRDHRTGWKRTSPISRDFYILINNEANKPFSIGYRGSTLVRDMGARFFEKAVAPSEIGRLKALASRAASAPAYVAPTPPPPPPPPPATVAAAEPSPEPEQVTPRDPAEREPVIPSTPPVTVAPRAPEPPAEPKKPDPPKPPSKPEVPQIPDNPIPAPPTTPKTPVPAIPPAPEVPLPPVPPPPSDGLIIPPAPTCDETPADDELS